MQRHPFDPVSAILGVLAVALGVLVATRSLGGFDTAGGWWLAAAAAAVGVAIIPWNLLGARAARDEHDGAAVEGPGPSVGTDAEPGEGADDPQPVAHRLVAVGLETGALYAAALGRA